jgi:hypothetical protein
MADQQYGIKIDKWPGLASNRSPHTAPSYAVEQDNMQCLIPGVLSVRKGMRVASFVAKDTVSAYEIISMYRDYTPSAELILFQNSNGDVYVARTPS